MNPEALEAAYKLFVDTGYNGTSDDFSSLINSNQEALNASFNQFTETGYNGTEEDFKVLLGVSGETTKPKEEEVVKTDDVELVGEVVPIKEKEKAFTPNPEGEAYYERLKARDGMMNAEVAAYENWKTENKSEIKEVKEVKTDKTTGLPVVDVLEGVNSDYSLEINESNPLFNKDVSEDFVYVPKSKAVNDLILKSDSLNKDTELDINSIEYYYPGRFEMKVESRGDDDIQIPTKVYYDTEETNFFGGPKEVDIQEFLGPIEKERRNKESQKLQNSYKGDVDAFVESELEVSSTADKDLKEFYKIGVRGFPGELTDNAEKIISSTKKRFDKGQFLMSEREIFNEYKKTGEIPIEKILRNKANAGEKAYDQDGNLIGVKLGEEPITKMIVGQNGLDKDDITLVQDKANELQEKTPTVDKLKEIRNNLFFDQMVLGREIGTKEDKVLETEGLMNTLVRDREQINEITGSRGVLGLFESDVTAKEATSIATSFGEEGFMIGSLKKIKSNDPTALQYNENLIQLLAVDRAIKLNSNLMTATEESNASRVANRLYTGLFNAGVSTSADEEGRSVRGGNTITQEALAYSNVLRDAGLVVDEDILNEDINQTSFGEGALDIATDMAPLLLSIAATKKMSVGFGGKTYGVKPALSKMDVIARTLGKGKSPALQKTIKLINGAAKEVVTIGAANEFMYNVFNGHKMPIQDAVVFGMGNSIVAGMSKYMLGKTIPYLSKYTKTKFGIGATVPLRLATGGVTATSIGKANEGIQLNVNYWLGNSTEEEYDKGLEHLMDIQSWGQEIVAFTALGVRGEVFSDAKRRILDVDSRSKMTISAAKELGIKEFSTDKEIIDAKNKKLKEQGIAVVQSFGKKRTTEEQNTINNLNLAVETLRTQNTIVQSKEIIKNNTNDRLKTEERLDIIAQKVSSGQELNVEDIKEIGKFSDTPVGNESNGYNVRTPVEALSKVLASKLGIETSGQQFNNFQKALATNAQVSKIANIQFRGESKQTKSLKDDYIGKNLDLQKVLNEYNNLKRSVDANPEIASISKQLLRDTKSRLESIDKEMQDLVDKNREIEGIDFETDVAFVKAEAEKLGIGFEVMDARSFINAANKGKFSSDNTGVYVPSENKIYINKDAALEKGNVSVASHELAHALTRRAFKNANGTFTLEGIKTIDSFINDVMSNEQRSLVEDRISQNYNPESKDFKEKYYEEYLNVFLDGVKRGEFKMNDTFKQSLNSIFKSRNKVDLSTGQGVKNFIDILNRSSKKGSLDTRLKELYEAGEVAAEGEALTGEAPASKDAPRLTPLQEINKLIPKNFKVEGISQELKSKEDYDKYIRSRAGQSLVSSIYTSGGVINNYIRSRQESKAEGDKIIDNVADRLLNFNPESKRADGSLVGIEGFGESIFANTRFGKLDAKRDLAIEAERRKKTVSTDDEQARQIASTGTTTKVDGEKAKVTPKSKVTRDFPEIFTEDLKNEIDISLLKIFTGDIPGVESKEFKSFITEASRGELTKKIKKALGGGKNYEFSVKKMAEKMKETLDPRFFVRLESQKNPENRIFTKPPRRLTKKTDIEAAFLRDKVYVENVEQGANIYEFKDFTPKQLSDFLLAPTTSPTTGAKSGLRGTRKTAFAEGLVDRLTRDATPQNLKRIGKETGEIAEISKKMQVDPSTIMASKDISRDFIKRTGIKGYNLERLKKDLKLIEERKGDKVPEEVKNLLIDFKRGDMIIASQTTPTFLTESKLFKGIKFNGENITFEDIFDGKVGKGVWGQVKKNGKKIYEEYDLPRIEEQIEQAIQFAEVFPKAFLKGENLMQTFFMGTRSTAKQVRTLLDGKSETPKYVKGTVNPKTGVGIEIGSVATLKNQRARLEKALGSGKTSKFFKDLIADYKPEGVQKGALKKAMEKASTDAERIEILQKAINKGDNKIKSDLYYAIESAKQEWLYSSKDKNEFIRRAKFIYQGASSNTNLILGSSRQFVPIEAVYFKPGEKFSFEKLKLEHLKSSLKQSMDAARAVVEGRFIEQGRDIMSDYKGIISEKKYLDVIDKIGGTTNISGLARMTADLNNLKNYRTVESGFKETLYDKIIKEAAKEINEKSSELENSFISDLVAKYIAEPTPSNEIILKSKIKDKANLRKLKIQNKSVIEEASMASKDLSQREMLNELNKRDKAFRLANERNKTIKKARVFDFDDTIARSKSKVFAEKDGKRKTLTAEDFAKQGEKLISEGWKMDFTDFNKVVEGKKGPLFDLIKTMKEAPGDRDIFILTARAPESQKAIYEFMKAMGVEIPLENITGLGRSEGKAKADWIVDKASEGYNDFYFADDAKSNVKAVRDVLEQLDVKSQVQQAFASKDLSRDFNDIIEQSTGIGAEKIFSDVKAEIRGNKARRQKFFIPPSAEDFTGLLYRTLGKGKKGEAHMKFYQENLLDPYARAMENLSTDRVNLMADFKALKKELDVPKDLRKTTESGFTNEQAVRTYLWGKSGKEVPGLSKTDMKELSDLVENNPKLKAFADQIMSITKGDGYSTPTKNWATGTITTDLIDVLNTTKRAKYLETWNQNKDIIFSKDNLNKLEAAYGTKYRESMENILKRMKSGRNRIEGGNVLSNKVLDYINNSTGAIMFFNTRSAVLQTISAANFINWGFNNPFRAGKAFANQPQYWKDFVKLINSDYLKDRRNGLKLNISESEIADAAKTSTNKAKAGINYILEKGYLPTKFADSFAIAAGGATFYRNRINDLIKNEGLTKSEAEIRAMKEFREVSEISQQSSDPSKISSQQASTLGRVVLQFANTPMQYARIQKRAVQDIVNGRGDLKTNISKIAYYGFLQNMLFNSLQQGLFALGFGDDEIDEKEEKKIIEMANGMVDSSLRGLGFAGVTVQVLKNLGIDLYDRSKRDRPEYSDSYIKLLEFSPAIKSKLSKFRGAAYPFDSKKRRAEVFEKGFSLDNPAYESMAKVVTATTNVPLDRLYSKVNNLSAAMDEETETWQSIAMVLGWPEWQIKQKNYVEKVKKPKGYSRKTYGSGSYKKKTY
mgnify:FL=1